MTAGATQSGISAELATGASIQGTVTATGGAPLADISVYAYRVDGSDLESVGYDETAANGSYDVGGLPAGDYKLEFVDEKLGNAYAAEWWDDALTPGTATAFTVAASSTVAGKNAVLIPGGHITGTVTGPTGSPLAGVDVTTYRLVDGDYRQQNYAVTNGSGAYDLNGLPQGTYKVEFDDGPGGLPTEYWNDVATFGAATTIAVAASATVPNISAQLGTPVTPTVTPGTPTISGTPQVGSVLTANPGTWNPVDVSLTYQWLANDVPIGGATGTTFTPTAGQLNATIKVTVTGTKLGWTQASNTSAGVGPVTGPAGPTAVSNTGLPAVSGVAKVGATLTASGGTWNPSGVTLAYQWLANGAPIAGATGTSYSVPAGDVGKQLSVRVTGSMAGYTPASATSPATGAVAPGTITATKKPKLTGKAKVSKTLGLDVGKYVPAGAKVKIAWFLNGKKISGQKKNSLAIKAAYLGKTITAEVTVTAAGYSKLVLETKGKKVT